MIQYYDSVDKRRTFPRLEKRGYAGSVSAWLSGLFNGQEDPCEEYYRAAMVDPAFEVCLENCGRKLKYDRRRNYNTDVLSVTLLYKNDKPLKHGIAPM